MQKINFNTRIAVESDQQYASEISDETERSAIARGSGISKRSPATIIEKMLAGRAVIAVSKDGNWAGFSYIDSWANGEFVSNSGLIVAPAYRKAGVAKAIKQKIFRLSRKLFPKAKIFSITTGLAIMKMNSRLLFETVTFQQLPQDPSFWKGCSSCVNYGILKTKNYQNCLCTAMVYTPSDIQHLATKNLATKNLATTHPQSQKAGNTICGNIKTPSTKTGNAHPESQKPSGNVR